MMRLYSSRILIINIIIFSLFVCIFNADAAASADDRNVEDAAESPKKPVLLTGTGKEAQTHYEILLFNIADYIAAENSMILQACGMLSKSDLFQKSSFVVQEDIALILYTLSKESESHAEALVQTLRDGDVEVSQGEKVLLALGRCVPEFNSNDIRKITEIYKKKWKHVGAHKISQSRRGVERRYSRLKNEARFSAELKTILWKMCPIFANSELQFDNQKSDCLTGESAKKYYGILQVNLARERVTVECSPMLKVCDALAYDDCFRSSKIWSQSDIETVLYLLCLESSRNVEKLANTFRQEDYHVSRGKEVLYALGECVPAVNGDDLKEMLDSFPDVYKRDQVVFDIEHRYRLSGLRCFERFSLVLRKRLWVMHRGFALNPPFPHPMSGAAVSKCPPQPNFPPHRKNAMRYAEFALQSQSADLESEHDHLLPSNLFEEEFVPQSQTADLESELDHLLPSNLFEEVMAKFAPVFRGPYFP